MELAEACSITAFEQAIDDVDAGLPSHQIVASIKNTHLN